MATHLINIYRGNANVFMFWLSLVRPENEVLRFHILLENAHARSESLSDLHAVFFFRKPVKFSTSVYRTRTSVANHLPVNLCRMKFRLRKSEQKVKKKSHYGLIFYRTNLL